MRNKYMLIGVVGIVVGVLLSSAVFVLAGNPDSPAAPGATSSYDLEDIYNRLDSGADGAQSTFTEPGVAPGTGTMHTLNEIMAKAPVKDDANGATTADVLTNKTYWSRRTADWGHQTGTMPNNGAVTITPTTTNQAIAMGYHDGTGYCEGDPDLLASNIVSGTVIFGVTGTYPLAPVPKTGQTKCYTDTDNSEVNCPAAGWPGQDGDHQKGVAWPNPRFTDNLDGTVTDNLTGLIWLKDANCILTQYPGYDADGQVTWQQALQFVAGINAGTYPNCGAGRTDWRLPNVRELFSLIDFSQFGPALPSVHPFTGVQSSRYWSSTTRATDTSRAWRVDLTGGLVNSDEKTTPPCYVWPVRGGQ